MLVLMAIRLPAEMLFTDVTAAANILHSHSFAPEEAFWNREHAWATGGAVAEDFDGDGWIDLYVVQSGASPNLLYMNQGDRTFSNQAGTRGAALTGAYVGACAADYDSDGDVDIFISAATAPHILLVNDGSGNFSQDPQVFSVPAIGATSPSWGDLDNDGLLDLALGAWNQEGKGDLKIYRNAGNGQLLLHQSLPRDWVYTPRFADLDGDGFQDLLAIADFGQTSWYRNGKDGLFRPAGTSDVQNGMGGAISDIDNDGDLDVFISSIRDFDEADFNWGTTGNRLLLNDGSGGFTDITESAGVRDGFWGWGSAFADFDNDGDLDLYQVNGWPANNAGVPEQFNNKPALLFENLGGHAFQEVSAASGDAGNTGQGRCVAVLDYDNDGDEDIFIANNSVLIIDGEFFAWETAPPVLLRNDSVNTNHSLSVRLDGAEAPHHHHGIGSRVYLTKGATTQMRELNASSGFNGHGPERIARFGLGSATTSDVVRAVWTNGDETELQSVAADQSITLPSPKASVSQRVIQPGQSIVAEILTVDLPPGATAQWVIDSVIYSNPATITLSTSGRHALRLEISDSSGFIRSETLMVTVRELGVVGKSIARQWNEQNLAAIRLDFPDPTVHARNLFHCSVAMWDAWAAYDTQAVGVLHHEKAIAGEIESARNESISYAAFRILKARYAGTVNASTTLASLDLLMAELGYDPTNTTVIGNTPAALGNRVAATVLSYASSDGSGDPAAYPGGSYAPTNDPLPVAESGTVMNDPNRWQPLQFVVSITQNGQTNDSIQSALGSHWGGVRPSALSSLAENPLHLDPGPPPQLGGATDAAFKQGNVEVLTFSSLLDPADGNLIDISPGTLGNNPLGSNDGSGYPLNPITGLPYTTNVVNHADFGRVLAEFWADGPQSETPPGHWNVLANEVTDSLGFLRKIGGIDPELNPLEWDVKLYLALNGALHDAAIAAWGCKRVYDFVRPISSIRYMAGRGQSSNPGGVSYDPLGLPLVPGVIELITPASSASGERHAHLAAYPGEIAVRAWTATILPKGVHWIRGVDWLPYQRDTFVTPAFPGYVSGHSTFSRAAAEVLTRITGTAYFPGGLGTFTAAQNAYLEFDTGPSTDVVLQWATYFDAADQAGLSRLYGGIHVPADDGPGRIIGAECGITAWNLARKYYDGSIKEEPFSARLEPDNSGGVQLDWGAIRGAFYQIQQSDDLIAGGFTNSVGPIQAGETTENISIPAATPRNFFRVIRSFDLP